MAFGSKNDRKKMLSSIMDEANGEDILGQIDNEIQSEDNRSQGLGAKAAGDSLSDTYENISSMKRSLGERKQADAKASAAMQKQNGKPSVARDWLTYLFGQEEADAPEVAAKREELQSIGPSTSRSDLTDKARKASNLERAVAAIKANKEKPVSERDRTFLDTGVLTDEFPARPTVDTPMSQDLDSIRTDAERIEDTQYLSGSGVSIEDRFPEEGGTLGSMDSTFVDDEFTGPDDVPITKSDTKGLMSRSYDADRMKDINSAGRFSNPVNSLYTTFESDEGEDAHLGGADYQELGITLGYGIVPTSGLKYEHNGKVISLPKDKTKRWAALTSAGVTTDNFDSSNVITTDAIKDGIKRSDYNSDEEWTKEIISTFEVSTKAEIEAEGIDVFDLKDKVVEGVTSLAYNSGGHKWKAMGPAYKEMGKTNPDMAIVQTGMLQVFTSGGIVIRGLGDRRAKDYNLVAEGLDQPTIESYTPVELANGNAGFDYLLSDGTTITMDSGKDYATKASQGSFKDYLDQAVTIS